MRCVQHVPFLGALEWINLLYFVSINSVCVNFVSFNVCNILNQPPATKQTKPDTSSPPKASEEASKPEPPSWTKPKPEPKTVKPPTQVETKSSPSSSSSDQQHNEVVVVELQGVVTDLTSTVVKHEARIAVLEELSHVLKINP